MTDIYRDMSEDGWGYLGNPRVGLPSADIPSGSILFPAATTYSGHLLRGYVINTTGGAAVVAEDGTYTGTPTTIQFQLYVDGVYVGTRVYNTGSGLYGGSGKHRRGVGTGSIGTVSSSTSAKPAW